MGREAEMAEACTLTLYKLSKFCKGLIDTPVPYITTFALFGYRFPGLAPEKLYLARYDLLVFGFLASPTIFSTSSEYMTLFYNNIKIIHAVRLRGARLVCKRQRLL